MPCDCGSRGGPTYHGEWMSCEERLCVARTIILAMKKHTEENFISLPSDLEKKIDAEITELLKHKRGELEKDIKNLRYEFADIKRAREKIKELGGSDEPLNEREYKLRAKMEELESTTDEELLA